MKDLEQRQMKLAETSSFYFIGFQPPLSQEELKEIPLPSVELPGGKGPFRWGPYIEEHEDGTMDIGFPETPFILGESFVDYAERLAAHLGNCALDTEVRDIGPGPVIAQANGLAPAW